MLEDQKEYVPSLMGKSNNSIIDILSIITLEKIVRFMLSISNS